MFACSVIFIWIFNPDVWTESYVYAIINYFPVGDKQGVVT